MNATLTDKLLLAEAARIEFERNIKALFGEHAEVSIGVHFNSAAFEEAPAAWMRIECEGSHWARSNDLIGHVSVFEAKS